MIGDRVLTPSVFILSKKYLEMRRIQDFAHNLPTAVLFCLLELSVDKVNAAVIPNPAIEAFRLASEQAEDYILWLRDVLIVHVGEGRDEAMGYLNSIGENVSTRFVLQECVQSNFEQFCIYTNIKLNFFGETFNPKSKLEVSIDQENSVCFLLYKSLAWESSIALPCQHIGLKFHYFQALAARAQSVAQSLEELQSAEVLCEVCGTDVTGVAAAAAFGYLQYQECEDESKRCYRCHQDVNNLRPSAICSHQVCGMCALRNMLTADMYFTPCCMKLVRTPQVLSLLQEMESIPAINKLLDRNIGHFSWLNFWKTQVDKEWGLSIATGACEKCWLVKGSAVEPCTCHIKKDPVQELLNPPPSRVRTKSIDAVMEDDVDLGQSSSSLSQSDVPLASQKHLQPPDESELYQQLKGSDKVQREELDELAQGRIGMGEESNKKADTAKKLRGVLEYHYPVQPGAPRSGHTNPQALPTSPSLPSPYQGNKSRERRIHSPKPSEEGKREEVKVEAKARQGVDAAPNPFPQPSGTKNLLQGNAAVPRGEFPIHQFEPEMALGSNKRGIEQGETFVGKEETKQSVTPSFVPGLWDDKIDDDTEFEEDERPKIAAIPSSLILTAAGQVHRDNPGAENAEERKEGGSGKIRPTCRKICATCRLDIDLSSLALHCEGFCECKNCSAQTALSNDFICNKCNIAFSDSQKRRINEEYIRCQHCGVVVKKFRETITAHCWKCVDIKFIESTVSYSCKPCRIEKSDGYLKKLNLQQTVNLKMKVACCDPDEDPDKPSLVDSQLPCQHGVCLRHIKYLKRCRICRVSDSPPESSKSTDPPPLPVEGKAPSRTAQPVAVHISEEAGLAAVGESEKGHEASADEKVCGSCGIRFLVDRPFLHCKGCCECRVCSVQTALTNKFACKICGSQFDLNRREYINKRYFHCRHCNLALNRSKQAVSQHCWRCIDIEINVTTALLVCEQCNLRSTVYEPASTHLQLLMESKMKVACCDPGEETQVRWKVPSCGHGVCRRHRDYLHFCRFCQTSIPDPALIELIDPQPNPPISSELHERPSEATEERKGPVPSEGIRDEIAYDEICRTCGSAFEKSASLLQCQNRCECLSCSVQTAFSNSFICSKCNYTFSGRRKEFIKNLYFRCVHCGLVTSKSRETVPSHCWKCSTVKPRGQTLSFYCARCEDRRQADISSCEDLRRILQMEMRVACCDPDEESRDYSQLICGHGVCVRHKGNLKLCRICQFPASPNPPVSAKLPAPQPLQSIERQTIQTQATGKTEESKGLAAGEEDRKGREVSANRKTCQTCGVEFEIRVPYLHCGKGCECRTCSVQTALTNNFVCHKCHSAFDAEQNAFIDEHFFLCKHCGIVTKKSRQTLIKHCWRCTKIIFSGTSATCSCIYCQLRRPISELPAINLQETDILKMKAACCDPDEDSRVKWRLSCGHRICQRHKDHLRCCRYCQKSIPSNSQLIRI